MNTATTFASTDPAPPQVLGWMGAYFLRTSPLRGAVVVGAVAVITSVILTAISTKLLLHGAGRDFWVGIGLAVLVPSMVAPPIAWVIVRLMHELVVARGTVEKLAVTDALTGTFNRRHLHEVGTREVARAQRSAAPLSLLVLDLDDFKRVNDVHGHLTGDAVLQAVGQACLAGVRPYDLVARYGGEELVVLLPATPIDEARQLAERLRLAIASLNVNVRDDLTIAPTASIGVAALDQTAASLDALFARADAAMYEAKRAGKNRVVVG